LDLRVSEEGSFPYQGKVFKTLERKVFGKISEEGLAIPSYPRKERKPGREAS